MFSPRVVPTLEATIVPRPAERLSHSLVGSWNFELGPFRLFVSHPIEDDTVSTGGEAGHQVARYRLGPNRTIIEANTRL